MKSTYVVSKSKKVSDLINDRTNIYKVRSDTSIHEAALYMREMHVRAVGVVNEKDELIGLVSHSDFSNKVAAMDFGKFDIYHSPVSQIMSVNTIFIRENKVVTDCLNLMLELNINHLVVLDENDKFLGLISRKDVDRACLNQLEEYALALQEFITGV